ncbi:MAG: hypothetical protein ACYDCI_13170, partial [Candidatus Limnocylindrales bacterium]
NHDFLIDTLGYQDGRAVYDSVEPLLAWDHHFWLQRGSLEVEATRLDVAETYLREARGISPDDHNVRNEWAYLTYKKANANAVAPNAGDLAREAQHTLRELMLSGGLRAVHSFHLYGTQGLLWAVRGVPANERSAFILDLRDELARGLHEFPESDRLRQLKADIDRAYLATAVD